jgi:hypothetical protein
VRGKTIAVDPYFALDREVVNHKPSLHIFQSTSDDFFATGFIEALGIRISFSFIDGMHLIEYLLRDFINTEARSDRNGVIAIHDCCPSTLDMTTRDFDRKSDSAWTGDIWKIVPILQQLRPDLKLTILGCKPTGLLLVSNLDPQSKVLSENLERIQKDWVDVTLGAYGVDRYFNSFEYTEAGDYIASDFPDFKDIRLSHDLVRTPRFVS